MSDSTQKGHPKGLYVLFATEMWERFNFYGMRAILTLFLINALAFKESEASVIYGGFLGLCYLTPMLGGFVADRYLGNRLCIQLGGLTMGIGQLLLFTTATVYSSNLGLAHSVMWVALGVIILGNGFFKPNISSMVGSLYPKGDNRLDSAFTIFYMGINLGAFIGNLICSNVGDVKHDDMRDVSAFKWGFLAASIAMFLGVIVFTFLKNKYIVTPEGKAIGAKPDAAKLQESGEQQAKFSMSSVGMWSAIAVGLACLFYFVIGQNIVYSIIYSSGLSLAGLIITDKSLKKEERDRIAAVYIVGFFVIFFWACFEQAGSSLTYIADTQTDTHLFGWEMPPTLVQNFNSIFVIALAPIFGALWIFLNKRKMEPISPVKQSIGLMILALGYVVIAFQVKGLGDAKLGVVWLVVMYLLHTIGELCLSPIGLSLVAKLAPARFASLLMGVFFLSNASGYALAGTLGALIPNDVEKVVSMDAKDFKYVLIPAHDTIPEKSMMVANSDSAYVVSNLPEPAAYFKENFDQQKSDSLGFILAKSKEGYAVWDFDTTWVKKRDEKGHLDSTCTLHTIKNNYVHPVFTFPLYKFKQILNVTQEKATGDNAEAQAKIDKSWEKGKSDRVARFAFCNNGKNIAVWGKDQVTIWDLNPAKPKFMGFEIKNLFQFLLVFVFLPGSAGILLLLLAPLLKKLMHGVR